MCGVRARLVRRVSSPLRRMKIAIWLFIARRRMTRACKVLGPSASHVHTPFRVLFPDDDGAYLSSPFNLNHNSNEFKC